MRTVHDDLTTIDRFRVALWLPGQSYNGNGFLAKTQRHLSVGKFNGAVFITRLFDHPQFSAWQGIVLLALC
jgi:hypothetical protein